MKNGVGASFTTYSNKLMDLQDPTEDTIDWCDIVQGLSQVARFAGQSPVLLTVAQHSVCVAMRLREQGEPPDVQWEGLMHDAEEAYPPGDMVRPFKYLEENRQVLNAQLRIKATIAKKFGLPFSKSTAVDDADKRECQYERTCFYDITTGCLEREWAWTPEHARFMFQAWTMMILSERPQSAKLLAMIENTVPQQVLDFSRSMGGAGSLRRENMMGQDWEAGLSLDLRRVFVKYGLDPGGPKFVQLIDAMESIEKGSFGGGNAVD